MIRNDQLNISFPLFLPFSLPVFLSVKIQNIWYTPERAYGTRIQERAKLTKSLFLEIQKLLREKRQQTVNKLQVVRRLWRKCTQQSESEGLPHIRWSRKARRKVGCQQTPGLAVQVQCLVLHSLLQSLVLALDMVSSHLTPQPLPWRHFWQAWEGRGGRSRAEAGDQKSVVFVLKELSY